MGVPTALTLSGPGGSWVRGAGSGTQVLKFIYDPDSKMLADNCSTARQIEGTLNNFQCSFVDDCHRPNITLTSGPAWEGFVSLRAGYYAVCYCEFECHVFDRWNLLKWQLVAGPEKLMAGTFEQDLRVFAGRTFDLTVFGQGLSTSDRLIFLHKGSCGSVASVSTSKISFYESSVPSLTSAPMAGIITSIHPEVDGVRLVMVVSHGLSINDTIFLSNVTVNTDDIICKPVFSYALGRQWSHCEEALTNYHSRIVRIPSSTQLVIDVSMTADECNAVGITGAMWHRTSREIFRDVYAARGSRGVYRVCWGQNPVSEFYYKAEAGVLTVLQPATFKSAVHLTTRVPGIVAPSIVAFQFGNSLAYSTEDGHMSLLIGFRNASRFRQNGFLCFHDYSDRL
jgi:hypothetical protein